ncbi:MAG: hypothetical protein K0R49_1556, partial [Burkholderiales bacterium]|nr:hypothetical protein [Burkholderiales bacterium]
MPVLVVVRHAEDNNSGLDEHGWAHAAAYGHLFKLFASTDKYPRLNDLMNNGTLCPFKSIVSYYTGKPKQTAESIRDNLDLSGYEIWGSDSKPNINIPERKAGISTILIMNRQSLWGEGGKPDKGTFLDRAIPYGSERDKIIKAGSPMFNYMYVFTYQNNTTLNNVSIFAQKYNYSGRTNQCNVRLHDGSVNNPIII